MEQNWVRLAAKEIRSLRSFEDLKSLNQKLLFLLLRARGDFIKGTLVPPMLQIEPTNNCNLRCICCSGYSNARKRGYMDFKMFCNIIDEAADIGVKRIHLYLHGEPLLHPQIGEMLRHVKSRSLAVTLATNVMLLNRKKMRDIMSSGMKRSDYILLSVLGYSKETHEKIQRGVIHEQVVNNVKALIEYRKANKLKGPFIETVFYRMSENGGEEDEYREYWRKIVDEARIARESEQYAEFRDGAEKVPVRSKTCKHLWERMSIHWNGNVALCVGDIDGKYMLGNLKENSISEIWNGSEVSRIRQLHRESRFAELPLCARCDW